MKERPVTQRNIRSTINVSEVLEVSAQFPLLHAYGVGYDEFRKLPEIKRGPVLEYAKYMLAYELDAEIFAAYTLLKALGIPKKPKPENYVKADYIDYIYFFWRQQFAKCQADRERWPTEMPLGVYAMAALILEGSIRVVEDIKPNYYIAVQTSGRVQLEKNLAENSKFKRPDEKRFLWIGDRVDEQENSLQGVDAVESEKEEKDG